MKSLLLLCAMTMTASLSLATQPRPDTPLEQQIRELEAQLYSGGEQQIDTGVKAQLNELYAQRPENQRPNGDPLDQGTDTCPGTLIYYLPYSDFGTTVGYANNYSAPVPCNLSNAGDAVYYLVAEYTGMYTVSLCGSSYDTYLYVVEGACTLNQVACNDDYCGLSSQVSFMATAGTVYTIFVDGYNTHEGSYVMNVTDGCVVDVQPGDQSECWENLDYPYTQCNGGCTYLDFIPEQYQNLTCGQTVFGTGFRYVGFSPQIADDRDWYAFTLTQACTVRVHGVAEFPFRLQIVSRGCPTDIIYNFDTARPCTPLTVATGGHLPPGDYAMVVSAVSSASYRQYYPREYRATLECAPAAGGVPEAPEDLVIRYASSMLRLNWEPVTQDTSGNPIDVGHYVVYSSTNGTQWDSIGTPNPPDATVFNTTNLSAAKKFYRVRAVAD